MTDGGGRANGNYDLQLTVWDVLSGGLRQAQPTFVTLTRTNVTVTGGVFTVRGFQRDLRMNK